MKIYSTGMNPADSNTLKRKPRVRLFQAYVTMMLRLRHQGHDLTWKATKVGDNLPIDTDVVIVSSMLPRSLNCPYALGAMWAISEALSRDIPIILYMTDWAFFAAHNEFRSIAREGEEYFFKTIGGHPQYAENPEKLRAAAPFLLEVCRQYYSPKSILWERAQILVPRFTNWGNVRIVQGMLPGANPVLTFDPTPIFLKYLELNTKDTQIIPMEERQRRWILPSLLKNDQWIDKQNLEWPVERFGPKGFEVIPSEWGIRQEYAKSVGALCPPYRHEGSGWWRSRWIHSAHARSILLSGPQDARAAGFPVFRSGHRYELMSDEELTQAAEEQAVAIEERLQRDFGVMDHQLETALKEARK